MYKYKAIELDELNNLPIGTIFKFETHDSEENTYWNLRYCKYKNGFVYLGGGIDFGQAIGKLVSAEDVLDEVNDNDEPKIEILFKT